MKRSEYLFQAAREFFDIGYFDRISMAVPAHYEATDNPSYEGWTVPEFADPTRRILISADMESYSRRDNVLQYRAQQAFHKIMHQAADELLLDRVNWLIQQGGDGELAVLPAGTSERQVITRLAPTVDRLLREHNRGLDDQARVRLRLGVHEGLVHLDGANGYPGEAVVTVCRLVDSPELKSTLKRFPGAAVAMIVSDRIYHDVVRHYRDLRPERFQRVTASLPDKGFAETAWIYVPDEDATRGGAASGDPHPDKPQPESPSGTTDNFSGTFTNNGPTNIGSHGVINMASGDERPGGAQ